MKHIIVVGSGLAGLTASVKASSLGAKVTLISPAPSEQSQSVMAMGGINAALNTKNQDDSIGEHYTDTIKGGNYLNSPSAVKQLTQDAPELVKWLGKIGTSFTRDENGNIDLRYFGGQKKMRTAYAGARTGKQIVTALTTLCRKLEVEGSIERLVGWRFLSLILTDDNICIGGIFINQDTDEIRSFCADSLIMATGGMNKVFGKTSGSVHTDGCATGRLLMQQVEIANPEMIQYHPTTIDTPVKRMLITEAARGQGGRLYVLRDNKPWYFMEEWYPEFGALMPRDVVSRSIYKVCHDLKLGIDGKNQVYLDITHLDKDVIEIKLDEVVEVCDEYLNLDVRKKPIPVYPGIHYFMGGIRTNCKHQTNISRLFAAGECSSQYHGANRLGGNSLLGAIHGGWIAAIESMKLTSLDNIISKEKQEEISINALNYEIKQYDKWSTTLFNDTYLSFEIEEKLAKIMNNSMGIYRNQKDLEDALIELDKLDSICSKVNSRGNYYEYIRIPALLLLARSMIIGALHRKESRGSHQRIEYPDVDKNYQKTTCITLVDNEICIEFKDLE